jgi:hypothetical protein
MEGFRQRPARPASDLVKIRLAVCERGDGDLKEI